MTSDEAGSAIVVAGIRRAPHRRCAHGREAAPAGDLSADRQYVFHGGEGGWQLRPMEYAFVSGRFAHVDDPVGHMHRMADNRPLTATERTALGHSSGG